MAWLEKIVDVVYSVVNWILFRFEGFGRVFFLCRASIFIIVATSALLILMPQGHEIGFTVSERPFWYFLPVIFCSVICWLWARVILNQEFGRILDSAGGGRNLGDLPRTKVEFWVRWIPRLIGVIPSFGAALAVFHANRLSNGTAPGNAYFLYSLAVAFAVLAFVWYRRRILNWLGFQTSNRDPNQKLGRIVVPSTDTSGDFSDMSALMKVSLVLGWIIPLGYLVPGLFWPASVGLLIGASAAVFIPAAFFVSLLSTFIFAFYGSKLEASGKENERKAFHFPVITVAFVISLVIPFFFDADRFEIRKYSETVEVDPRPDLNTAIETWMRANLNQEDPSQKADMIIVSTAGGALRAAMWTGTILGRLQDNVENFDNSLFAISGVSGGSLGATAYMSALWERNKEIDPDCSEGQQCMQSRIQQGLSSDFLGPVMLGLISNDISLIGLGPLSKDRAEALEEAWEIAWETTNPNLRNANAEPQNPFSQSYLSLWPDLKNRPWPLLLLNGTHQQLGSRIITGNIRSSGSFIEAYDFFKLHPESIPTSTAVHNSARFSYISPSGKIDKNNHVIDGGYFENYGAETALEIVRAVRELDKDNRITIRVIQIVSSPSMKRTYLDRIKADTNGIAPRVSESMLLGQYTAPLQGLLKTRESRGLHAAKRLRAEMGQNAEQNGEYFLFNMGDDQKSSNPTLSWFMPEFVRENIARVFKEGESDNKLIMDRLISCLNADDVEKSQTCAIAETSS